MLSGSGWRAITVAAALLLLSACGDKNAQAGGGGQGGDRPVLVTTQTVQPSSWNDSLEALGTAKANESVTLTAKVSEIVQDVHFESGQDVRAGQTLVTLRGDAAQASLVQAEATYAEAQRLYNRQQELAQQQLVARSTLDTQLALRDAAAARVAQMKADIGDRSVRAPFAGVLGIRQVSPGSLITPTTVIATLDDISRMYVDFQVPEAALATIHPGDAVSAVTAAYPGRKFEGKVETIDARVDPATRAVTVRATFDNPDRALRPGLLLDVNLFRPSRQALVIPEIAVVQVGRDSFVYRVKPDNTVEQAKVSTGVRREGVVEILEGVKAGDRIVIDGTGKLRPGAPITEGREDGTAKPAAAPAGKQG
ncbi:efflux RND transporter periplasmic adaptor subunit [Pseudoxanthomonas indica]|uniref:Membrane fusion protein, multidrug efflux system n=1 Tax=Pseudoxanthomonas indica TaxID=428993 RepID=A0A1T5JS54_9GAMM|nr:efflux RND transporter periplasmic adaptor subunit [Pseudoxanthomonas indica]GGD43991.1 MexH family multidrug efflux RND transporter periplasmic adaptor subunit [Pseudoxanthomonas indica]SKC54194.1 membrane fusion protein, multidrug efflux system [Pseudoxanthomonas indica]